VKRETRNLLLVLGALWLWRRRIATSSFEPASQPGSSADDDSPNVKRARVVNVALQELGQRDPLKYWRDVMPGVDDAQLEKYAKTRDWCGGFALWCIKQAGLAPDMHWKDGKGFCYQLPTTTDPKPGDIAFFKTLNHHAIVLNYDPVTGVLRTIDGNQGPKLHPDEPGSIRTTVTEHTRKASDATTFFSIAPLVEEKPLASVSPLRRTMPT
jgi:hypothetical protein